MRRPTIPALAVLAALMLVQFGCRFRPLDEDSYSGETAQIWIEIDWSGSNIPVSRAEPSGSGLVHRVAIRFFPTDGGPVFERYLESNIFEGLIDVPTGRYRVVVMNETVEDTGYWEDAIAFSDVDDYDKFAATIVAFPESSIVSEFPFYEREREERVIVEPYYLASWSIDGFEVTDHMSVVPVNYGTALEHIVMRPLTYNVNVTAHVKNLVSVQSMPAAVKGLADKVYMASALTGQTSGTHLFYFTRRQLDGTDGTAQRTFLSFGRLPDANSAAYSVEMDILLVSGELYTDDAPLVFDVTDQIESSVGVDIDIDVPEGSGSGGGGTIDLPYVEGGIAVDDWGDEEVTLN